ncbi:hypothetical protein QLL95_gp0331 [Cotonvirus japonicus]|uniref:Uncharacterized protein n=1 Tax=Cotonvirus japonicus TaxID=2811091 RepID=A0ABM7NUD4_9VIRU|nr:hypothetical protein QLL95_gp0331 [Cotonvirus japonicus]BCS83792.1 hypothetical protein [Cotonvirus japonicus]
MEQINCTQLIENIKSLDVEKYIKKKETNVIIDDLESLKPKLTNKDKKTIDSITELISKNAMKKDEKIKWNKSKKTLINIIKIYHEEYNDKDNEDTFCAQKGDIKQDLTIDNIEKQLDKKIPKYNGFNENHPMNGVTFDKSKNKYQVKFKNINTYGSDLEIISKKILESYVKKTTEIVQIYVKYNFIYQNHYFIVYSIEKQLYFDIQHIISVLNLKKSSWNDKYNEFSKYIEKYIWHKNEFDGYILRELVSRKSMFKIVLSSNSKFSKSFKDDVAEILDNLCDKDKLNITNDKISIQKSNKKNKIWMKIKMVEFLMLK